MNKALVIFCVLACIGSALAVRDQWTQLRRANPAKLHTIRFALTQFNVFALEKHLLDISNPRSANYGQWMSKDEVREFVAPSIEVSQSVATFLKNAGAKEVEDHRDMIKVTGTVKFIEDLLQTKLFNFQHKERNVKIIRAVSDYVIPAEIAKHVDFVSTLLEFPSIKASPVEVDMDAAAFDPFVVPTTLNELYGIPSSYNYTHPNSSLALIEFQDDQSYNKADLKQFSKDMGLPELTVSHVVGPYSGSSPDLESTLDVQFGAAIAQGVKIWFWTEENWMYEFATDLINYENPPLVCSMSWGWPEPLQCQVDTSKNCTSIKAKEYVNRTNTEFMKIGAMGISLFAASGDQGAPGDGNADCTNDKSPLSTIFPGASPWVVSVGATMYDNTTKNATGNFPPICKQYSCGGVLPEEVCTTPHALITSGGGFSNYVTMPEYQTEVVTAYLKSGVALPPSKDFTAANRGFPDISALGHHYLVRYEGSYSAVDGTSCSTPVTAAMISLLNSYRLSEGKKPLGFVVPLLYQAYAADATTYNDITTGDNKCTESCCAKVGYEATKGWDPVTGLGTPQFQKLLAFVQSLPN